MPFDARKDDAAAELRAEVARQQIPIYRLAALVGVHPSNLGQILRGRRPLTPEFAERIERTLRGEAAQPTAPTRRRGGMQPYDPEQENEIVSLSERFG